MNSSSPTDPSNAAQLAGWDGDTGAFWADNADRFDRGVAAYRDTFLDAAAVEEDSRVLDVGCGAGQATRDAARRAVSGSALGVDLSSRLLAVARRRAEDAQLANTTFEQADAQVHPFSPGGVDLAISRHGTMFFGDPDAAFANIARAVRPGGRLVLLTWRSIEHNEFMREVLTALTVRGDVAFPPTNGPSPLSLADPDRVRSLLDAAGFDDIELESVQRPMYFGADPEDAFDYLSRQYAGKVADLDAADTATAHERLRTSIAAHHTDDGVRYGSEAWLVRARRP